MLELLKGGEAVRGQIASTDRALDMLRPAAGTPSTVAADVVLSVLNGNERLKGERAS